MDKCPVGGKKKIKVGFLGVDKWNSDTICTSISGVQTSSSSKQIGYYCKYLCCVIPAHPWRQVAPVELQGEF
jgi:hypothetical protein